MSLGNLLSRQSCKEWHKMQMMLKGLAGLDYSTHLDLSLTVHKKMGNV